MKTFSELCLELPADSEIAKVAEKLAKEFAAEFDRRLAENGMLYRPWDDLE